MAGQKISVKLNLADPAIFEQQLRNTATFRPRWRRLLGSFVSMFVVIGLATEFPHDEIIWLVNGAIAVIGILTAVFGHQYRCPNCNVMPTGYSAALNGGVSIAKGFHFCPDRCVNCGYYLSIRALRRDFEKN